MRKIKDNTYKKDQGFTLIELIMVIVVLSILAFTVALKYFSIKTEASDASAQGITAALRGAVSILYSQNLVGDTKGTVYNMKDIVENAQILGVDGSASATNAFTATIGGKVYHWAWKAANLPTIPGFIVEYTGFTSATLFTTVTGF